MVTKHIFTSFSVLFILVVYSDVVENAVIKRMFMSNEIPGNMPTMYNNEGINYYQLQNIISSVQSLLQDYIQCKMSRGRESYGYMGYNQIGSSRPSYYEQYADYPMYTNYQSTDQPYSIPESIGSTDSPFMYYQ
ncbi:unnamed protein product [Schistosoma rodhaini]|uniref:Uncharacterized protein n=1 Tax=Schistosoma rodhaini TaxID=6188 RepID=A0AA85GAS8_9TREM|nr:unnamed protein product [Schistosoma rodhaini]